MGTPKGLERKGLDRAKCFASAVKRHSSLDTCATGRVPPLSWSIRSVPYQPARPQTPRRRLGHYMGMCQIGAVSMAENGSTYDMLRHCYAGSRSNGYIEILHSKVAFLPAGAEHPFT